MGLNMRSYIHATNALLCVSNWPNCTFSRCFRNFLAYLWQFPNINFINRRLHSASFACIFPVQLDNDLDYEIMMF